MEIGESGTSDRYTRTTEDSHRLDHGDCLRRSHLDDPTMWCSYYGTRLGVDMRLKQWILKLGLGPCGAICHEWEYTTSWPLRRTCAVCGMVELI